MQYTTNQIADKIGERPERLQYWLRMGMIKVEKGQRIKQGKPIEFSDRDLRILKIMTFLKDKHSMPVRKAYEIAKSLFDNNYQLQ